MPIFPLETPTLIQALRLTQSAKELALRANTHPVVISKASDLTRSQPNHRRAARRAAYHLMSELREIYHETAPGSYRQFLESYIGLLSDLSQQPIPGTEANSGERSGSGTDV